MTWRFDMKKIIFLSVIVCLFFGLGIIPIKAQDLAKGLVGYWPLDENGKDMVGKSEGKLEGGSKWIKNGRVKGAVELDGVTGHVVISNFELTTIDLTATAWLKGWRQDAWAGLMCSRNDPMSFWIGFTDADTLSYVWNNNSDKTWGWKQGPQIPQDEWAMFAITIAKDQAVSYIYTDAKKMVSAVNKIDHLEQTIADNLKFGWDQCCGPGRHVKGIMDEVMIYNRTLSEAELVKLATSGLAVERIDKLTTQWGKLKQ
jgi:hypothetical protein